MKKINLLVLALLLTSFSALNCQGTRKDLEKPERIVSWRQVIYDSSTYANLAQLWKEYYDAYPSEGAYGNWMYAARYAKLPEYSSLLEKGVEKYPASSTLLYLLGNEKHMKQEKNNLEALQLFEKAAALDPGYMDPWFGLAIDYQSQGEREKADAALRHLLEYGAVQDEVMDFSYNMITGLDSGAILISNGDNDTYPGWILTRIIKYRPDVIIVNRSLLNTDWYPQSVMKEGVPPFITQAGLDSLSKQVASEINEMGKTKKPFSSDWPLLGDRLVARIIEAAGSVGRPVYFACTLEDNKLLKQLASGGRKLGLATLVTPTSKPCEAQCRDLLKTWVTEFRTAGLDSWRVRYEKQSRAGRMLMRNYATALHCLKDQISAAGEGVQLSLFRWYRDHLLAILPADVADETNPMWCSKTAPREIQEWCKHQSIGR